MPDEKPKNYKLGPDGLAIEDDFIDEQRIKDVLTSINLPRQFWDYELEHFDLRNDSNNKRLNAKDKKQKTLAYELTKKYTDNIKSILHGGTVSMPSAKGSEVEANSIVFRGKEGSGKTLLSCVILKSALEFSHDVYYLPWVTLYDSLASYDEPDKIDMMEYRFHHSDLLVVDGLNEYAYIDNKFFKMKLETLFSYRFTRNLPLIWTMDLSKESMAQMFGPCVISFIKSSFLITLPQGADPSEFAKELGEIEDE
jgi:DNA replication protein DnaC